MKSRWHLTIFLSLLLLAFTVPVYAQVSGVGDEGAAVLIADTSSQDNPAAPGPATEEQTWHKGHSGGMMAHGWHEGRHAFWARFLNLSDEQKAKIKDIHKRFYLETRGLRYDLMEKRIEFKRLFLDAKTDAAAIMAKEREVSALRQKLHEAKIHMILDFRGVLTPEQLQKLDMMFLAHHEGMENGMGPMGMMSGHRGALVVWGCMKAA